MSSPIFQQFRDNLKVRNADDISTAYGNITKRLNKDFWNLDSDLYHRRQLGSYGRQTAIHGVSDLDMAFELPWAEYERYKNLFKIFSTIKQGKREKRTGDWC